MGNCKSYPDPNPDKTNTILKDKLKGEHFCSSSNFLPILLAGTIYAAEVFSGPIAAGIETGLILSGKTHDKLFPGEDYIEKKFDKSNILGLNDKRINYCKGIGDEDEWVFNGDTGNSCQYNDCHNTKEFPGGGCCKGCCAIAGKGVVCERSKYVGNPLVCCFNDYIISGDEIDGFQTPAKKRSCDVPYRDLGSKDCRDKIFDFCAGNLILSGQDDFTDAWVSNSSVNVNAPFERGSDYPQNKKQPCLKALYRSLFGQRGAFMDINDASNQVLTSQDYDLEGLLWGKKLMKQVMEKYINSYGGLFKRIDEDGLQDIPMYNVIKRVCMKDPALCSDSLKNVCSKITEDDIIKNISALEWCGCYMNDDQYKKYTDFYNVNKECTPFCNRDNNIPLTDELGSVKICQQNICIMDDISIKLSNVISGGGKLNFNQVCSGCGKVNVVKDSVKNDSTKNSNSVEQNTNNYGFFNKDEKSKIINTSVTNNTLVNTNDMNVSRCECHLSNNLKVENSILDNINYIQNCGNLNCYNNGNQSDCIDKNDESINKTNDVIISDQTRNFLIILGIIIIIFLILFFIF